MNKKGTIFSLVSVIQVILSILVVISTAYFFSGLLEWFVTPEESQMTRNSFDGLTNVIDALIADKEDLVVDTMPFYMEEHYILVGFSKGLDDKTDLKYGDKVVKKPLNRCGESACLCYYLTKKLDSPKDCKAYRDINYFIVPKEHQTSLIGFTGFFDPEFISVIKNSKNVVLEFNQPINLKVKKGVVFLDSSNTKKENYILLDIGIEEDKILIEI